MTIVNLSKTSDRYQPLISIVTVVRNDELGLARTRASIFDQSFKNWEWIVIDGLSSDKTLNALRGLEIDPRVRVVSESDESLYDAMNKGANIARGSYINLLNAGDLYASSDALLGCLPILTRASADVLFTSRIAIFGTGEQMKLPVRTKPDQIRHGLPTSHQSCFIRTSLQQSFPYKLDYKISADYRCLAEIIFSGVEVEYLDHVTVISDVGANSVSYRHPWGNIRDCARTQIEVFDMHWWQVLGSAIRRSLPMLFRRLAAHIPGLVWLVRRLLHRA